MSKQGRFMNIFKQILILLPTVATLSGCQLTVTNEGGGIVTSESGTINCGTVCTVSHDDVDVTEVLIATPDTGYIFTGWSGGFCSGTDQCSVTVGPETDDITVTATFLVDTGEIPVAYAGDDQAVLEDEIVQLDCTGSMDPEGKAITYQWTQTSGNNVVLDDAQSCSPSFTTGFGDQAYIFSLVVNDGSQNSLSDSVIVDAHQFAGKRISHHIDGLNSVLFSKLIGSINVNGTEEKIALDNDNAFIALHNAGLSIVDISDKSMPVELVTINDNQGWVVDVVAANSIGYFLKKGNTGIEDKLIIMDANQPSAPIAEIEGAVTVRGRIALHNERLYLQSDTGKLAIYDISTPSTPVLISNDNFPITVTAMIVSGNYLYATERSLLNIIDISDAENPIIISSLSTNSEYGLNQMTIVGDLMLAASYKHANFIDIKDPTQPKLLNTYTPPNSIKGISLISDYAVIATQYGGVQILDISNIENIINTGYELPGRWAYSVATQGDLVFIGGEGMSIYNINDIIKTNEIVDQLEIQYSNDIVVGEKNTHATDTHYAYVSSQNIINIYDIINPLKPQLVSSISHADSGYHTFLADETNGGYLYTVNRGQGLKIIDINNPAVPLISGGLAIEEARRVDVYGDKAYITSQTGIHIVDISNKSAPSELGFFPLAEGKTWGYLGIKVKGNYAYTIQQEYYDAELHIIDISNSSTPTLLASLPVSLAEQIQIEGDYAYITQRSYGFGVIDISNPSQPVQITRLDTRSSYSDVSIIDGQAFLTRSNGFYIYDLRNIYTPSLTGAYNVSTDRAESAVSKIGNYAAITDSFPGVSMFDISAKLILDNNYHKAETESKLTYSVNWESDVAKEVKCAVVEGSCSVIQTDLLTKTAIVEWTLPSKTGDYEIGIAAGHTNQFQSAEDRVMVTAPLQ
jgi:hypothetical protein